MQYRLLKMLKWTAPLNHVLMSLLIAGGDLLRAICLVITYKLSASDNLFQMLPGHTLVYCFCFILGIMGQN